MKTNITKICAGVFGTMLLAGLSLNSDAQVSVTGGSLTYTQDFNTLESATGTTFTTLPNGWALNELGTGANGQYRTGDGSTNNGDTYSLGTGTATDRALGGVASGTLQTTFGVVFTNNTGAVITNLAVTYVGEQWRYGGRTATAPATPIPDSLLFTYSTVATAVNDVTPANWISVPALNFTTPNIVSNSTTAVAVDGNLALNKTTITANIPVTIPVGGSIVLKWTDPNIAGNDDALSIDDLSITFSTGSAPVTSHIILQNKVPASGSNNVPLTTDKLIMKFDSAVAAGTGSIKLTKTGGATQTFTLPSTSVAFTHDSVIVSGIILENNSDYHVQYDSTVATNLGGTMKSVGIYNATTWMFSTEDTVTPPPPTPLTSLDEKFLNCINTEMGVFVEYSETGTTTWRCSRFGRNKATAGADSFAVYINGGSQAGVSVANKDWLISKAPLDFSAMQNPKLSFWQNRRFAGDVTRTLVISTDYVAGQNPTTATWTPISVPALSNAPDSNVFRIVDNINLTAHKATPFYLAFTYECGSNGAYELTYDDIKVEEATGIKMVNGATVGIQIVGEPTTNHINLNIDMNTNDQVELQLFDLLGRKVMSQNAKLTSGSNRISMNNLNLSAGMYVVRVIGTNGFGTVKAVVR